ncbi:hypothetical protein [Nonomuraea fuscirosea]|uniref:hypothetical protein n=1 Tax=Nonomuraea fuscirosea TaxID=1291556 RepID=UPI0034329CF0
MLRDQTCGCDHRKVLLSLVYRLVGCLFALLTVLVRSDLSKDVELLVLRHENQVLRRQLGSQPWWDHTDRLWLAALSRLIHRRRWAEVFPITPATILRWHRYLVARKWTFTDRRRPGLPCTRRPVKALIVRMARENPVGLKNSIHSSQRRALRPMGGRTQGLRLPKISSAQVMTM